MQGKAFFNATATFLHLKLSNLFIFHIEDVVNSRYNERVSLYQWIDVEECIEILTLGAFVARIAPILLNINNYIGIDDLVLICGVDCEYITINTHITHQNFIYALMLILSILLQYRAVRKIDRCFVSNLFV